jgi:hypothetical protein
VNYFPAAHLHILSFVYGDTALNTLVEFVRAVAYEELISLLTALSASYVGAPLDVK